MDNNLRKLIDNTLANNVVDVTFNGLQFSCKSVAEASEVDAFVDKCVELSFDEDGEYRPARTDLAKFAMTILIYTDIELPDDTEEINILKHSGIEEVINQYINNDQLKTINNSVDKKISYILSAEVRTLENEMEKALSSIEAFTKSIEDSFGGLSQDDIRNVTESLINNNITEEGLVKAIAKAK